MRRRQYLGIIGGTLSVSMAGCTSDSDDTENSGVNNDNTNQSPQVSQVSVSSENYSVEQAINLIEFNYATQTVAELRDPNGAAREPNAGNKWVVIHGEVTFESEREKQADVYAGAAVRLDTNDTLREGVAIIDLPTLKQTVSTGATFDGWMAIQVPEEVVKGTLVGYEVSNWFDHPTEIRFSRDSSLSANQYKAKNE